MARSILLLLLLVSSPLGAAEFLVDTPRDEIDVDPGDGVCGTATRHCSLRAAIQEGNALAGPDSIVLPAGEFAIQRLGEGEDQGGSGDFDVVDALVITGAGRDRTSVDAAGAASLFHVGGQRLEFALRDLQLRGASSAAVDCTGSATTCVFERVRLTRNTGPSAVDCGPASDCRFDEVVIEKNPVETAVVCGRCDFAASLVLDNAGAGIHATNAPITLADSTVARNAAEGIRWGGERVLVRRSLIEGNGVGFRGTRANPELRVVESTIRGNHGGGIDTGGRVILLRSAVVANERAGGCGGGISLKGGGSTGSTLVASTVSGNSAPRGGGICMLFHGGFTNPILSIQSSTVARNRADEGGGILVDPELHRQTPIGPPRFVLEESILAENRAETGPDCSASTQRSAGFPPALSLGGNLIGDASGCSIEPVAGDTFGSATDPVDPGLEKLADNGGQSPTHALRSDSPARDAISSSLCEQSAVSDPIYRQNRVRIAPDNDLVRRGGLQGAADTRWLTFSGWFEFTNPIGSVEHLLSVGDGLIEDNRFLRIAREQTGQLGVEIRDRDGRILLDATSDQIIDSLRTHSLILSFNGGMLYWFAFLDGEPMTFEALSKARGVIPWATQSSYHWSLFGPHVGEGGHFVGTAADVWIDNVFYSLLSGNERFRWYDMMHRPLDLGPRGANPKSGRAIPTPPLIYLGDAMVAEDWSSGANRGTGGDFETRGHVTDVVETPVAVEVFDQRGVRRPQGGACEIGAFEVSG